MCFKCLVWCTPVKKKCCKPERALEICDIGSLSSSSSSNLRGRHLSKSASELSCSPRCEEMTEIRPRSAAPPEHTHISVYQKAHSFFAQLKNRWGHGKHRERRHKSPGRQDSTTDYAADQSSDHSTPSTQSPRHRLHQTTCTDSPLSRVCVGDTPHSSPGGALLEDPHDLEPQHLAPWLALTSYRLLLVMMSLGGEKQLLGNIPFSNCEYIYVVVMDWLQWTKMLGGRLVYKSRTVYRDLNPTWDESFTVPIEDPFVPLQIKVFDYDWGLQHQSINYNTDELPSLEDRFFDFCSVMLAIHMYVPFMLCRIDP
ncbi:C2 domain [Popillia japonica]|uniref:C2 domain n=1 Tax=Popillia japonica TaxID=7064 RepID=A0AAW1JS12_POPJA